MSFLRKTFWIRRRIDAWALGIASMLMPVRIGLGPLILFLFSCIGVYLAAGRHATARLFAKKFYLFILLYGAWSLGLTLFRGEPFADNRQIGYTLLLVLFAFAGPGMVLIRDPLRVYVLGARLGTAVALLATIYLALTEGGRIGVGGNQAVFAFVVAVSAISASIPLSRAPVYLANGPHWLLLGLAAVLASETRAVIVVLPIFAAIEIVLFFRRYSLKHQSAIYAVLLTALAALIVVGPVGEVLSKRFAGMVEFYGTGDSSQWEDKVSADIRSAMWKSSIVLISEHPIAGVGAYGKMELVRQHAGDQARLLQGFRHVHNTILDELLNDGFVGLILMLAAFIPLFVYLWRLSDSWGMRRALLYFVIASASYGMLHNPLLHEVTIASVMFFLAALNATASRRVMAARRNGVDLISYKK